MGCRSNVEARCRNCDICVTYYEAATRLRGRLQSLAVGAPIEGVAVDVVRALPRTKEWNRPPPTFNSDGLYYKVTSSVSHTQPDRTGNGRCLRFPVGGMLRGPLEVHPDQGRHFESNLFGESCRLLSCKKTCSYPMHPQSDGTVERFNRTLQETLCMFVSEDQRDWDKPVPLFLVSSRSLKHAVWQDILSNSLTENYGFLSKFRSLEL